MRAMRAEGFSGYKDLKLADIPKPAVSDGRVLIRITAAGVTPLEHTILSGGYPRAKAPLVLGGEGAGVVEEGGGTGNGLSCWFACDVYRTVWRFRGWNLQRVGCCPKGESLLDSREHRQCFGCRCSRGLSYRPNDTELRRICERQDGAVTCHPEFVRERSHAVCTGR